MKRRRSAQKRRTRRRWLIFLLILLALLLFWPRRVSLEGLISPEAVLMDADSGEVLAAKNADASIYPASMTKVMTALLVLEANPDLDTPVTLPEDIFPELRAEGASMAGFRPGETATVRDLLYGALLPSGAECCEALAREVSGSEEAFVASMNRKAAALGMASTHFCNPTGLHDPELRRGKFLGGKTGYTSAAGLCLASAAEVKGKTYLMVTAGAQGNHNTEPYHVDDAVNVCRQLAR